MPVLKWQMKYHLRRTKCHQVWEAITTILYALCGLFLRPWNFDNEKHTETSKTNGVANKTEVGITYEKENAN